MATSRSSRSSRPIDLTHPAGTQQGGDAVWAQETSGIQRHLTSEKPAATFHKELCYHK